MPDEMKNPNACDKCGHAHTGIQLAYICIGCPCPETPGKPPDAKIKADG